MVALSPFGRYLPIPMLVRLGGVYYMVAIDLLLPDNVAKPITAGVLCALLLAHHVQSQPCVGAGTYCNCAHAAMFSVAVCGCIVSAARLLAPGHDNVLFGVFLGLCLPVGALAYWLNLRRARMFDRQESADTAIQMCLGAPLLSSSTLSVVCSTLALCWCARACARAFA